jgi:TonB family protein
MERVERQGTMKFRSNISFSVVVHAMVIAAAMTLAGWNAASHAPEKYVAVTLIGHAATLEQETGARGKESSKESVQSVRRERLRARVVAPSPLPERKETTPSPEPEKRSPVQDGADPAKRGQTEVRGPVPGDLDGGSREAFSGTMHEAVPVREGTGDNPAAGKDRTKGSDHGTLSAIRAAVERAKSYPLLAKRRNQEGTVVAEFSINAKGLPENVRVTRSSGFSLLDSAARETIVKAAPFPVVKGSIEVPITFILKKEN